MGAETSKTSSEPAKSLEQQVRAMKLERQTTDIAEDDYVDVANEKSSQFEPRRVLDKSLDVSVIAQWERTLLQDPKNRLALSAFTSGNLRSVLTSADTKLHDQQIFNIKIKSEGAPITNQRSSGRCWLFASTNVFRVPLMKQYNLERLELSQAYLFFWDKLEKANYFLEQILDTAEEDLGSRLVSTLLGDICSDGGQWDMVVNLVQKYGLVPQVLYPDSFNAKNSSLVNALVQTKLREDAIILRKLFYNASPGSINAMKEKMIKEIHLILTLTLGPPPSSTQKLKWDYVDKDGKACSKTITPLEFAGQLSKKAVISATGCEVDAMFSLVNDPRNPYMTKLTISRLGNIYSSTARPITYINVDMQTIKKACIAMLKADLPIFFGCDVGKYENSELGIMDLELIDYELGFNVRLGMNKAERLMVGESAATHAMVLTGVHLDENGKSVKWRVQNSWGEGPGEKGWFVMSDAWMDEFVYQTVVEPRFVDRAVRDVLTMEAKVLPLWDPMGVLA